MSLSTFSTLQSFNFHLISWLKTTNTFRPIQITPAGETAEEQDATLEVVEPSPGFPAAARLLAEAIEKEAITTVLDFTPQQVSLRFLIDGLWHSGTPMDRETGDFMLATLKKIAGLEYRERRARQEGKFTTLYRKKKQQVRLVSQGIKTGERVAIYLDWKKPPLETAEQLGMRASMIAQLSEILENRKGGMVLVSALPGEGYTSAWRGVLDTCDRLTRDYLRDRGKKRGRARSHQYLLDRVRPVQGRECHDAHSPVAAETTGCVGV